MLILSIRMSYSHHVRLVAAAFFLTLTAQNFLYPATNKDFGTPPQRVLRSAYSIAPQYGKPAAATKTRPGVAR